MLRLQSRKWYNLKIKLKIKNLIKWKEMWGLRHFWKSREMWLSSGCLHQSISQSFNLQPCYIITTSIIILWFILFYIIKHIAETYSFIIVLAGSISSCNDCWIVPCNIENERSLAQNWRFVRPETHQTWLIESQYYTSMHCLSLMCINVLPNFFASYFLKEYYGCSV